MVLVYLTSRPHNMSVWTLTLPTKASANPHTRGVFKGPYHSTSRVLNFWIPTVGCWIIEEFVCYTLIFAAYFSYKQTDLSSFQDNLAQNPKFVTDNRHCSQKGRALISNINTPLQAHTNCMYMEVISNSIQHMIRRNSVNPTESQCQNMK